MHTRARFSCGPAGLWHVGGCKASGVWGGTLGKNHWPHRSRLTTRTTWSQNLEKDPACFWKKKLFALSQWKSENGSSIGNVEVGLQGMRENSAFCSLGITWRVGWGAAATSPESLQAREIGVIIPGFPWQFAISKAFLHIPSHRLSSESQRMRAWKGSLILQMSIWSSGKVSESPGHTTKWWQSWAAAHLRCPGPMLILCRSQSTGWCFLPWRLKPSAYKNTSKMLKPVLQPVVNKLWVNWPKKEVQFLPWGLLFLIWDQDKHPQDLKKRKKKIVYQSVNISDTQNSTFSYCCEPQSMRRQREHARSIVLALHLLVWLKNANTAMFLPIKEHDSVIEKSRRVVPKGLQLCIYGQIQICKCCPWKWTDTPLFLHHISSVCKLTFVLTN